MNHKTRHQQNEHGDNAHGSSLSTPSYMHGGSLSDKSSSSVRGRQAVGVDSEAMRLHLSEMVPSRQRGSAVSWIFTIVPVTYLSGG
jgi:hypothetical protein